MDGVLIVDKPVGLTSHDVVARVRRLLKEKRVGHTGTLDPFATGVLVVLVGRATRLAQFLNTAEKEYEGVIRFGYATDTGDSTGTILPDSVASVPSQEFTQPWDSSTIEKALAKLRGTIEQTPPMYSAKKQKGKKLYELARRGEEVERKPVQVSIHEFEVVTMNESLLSHNADGTCDIAIRVVCSAGTYIRTLAESVGEGLGVAAHLLALRRTRAGDFLIKDANTLAEFEQLINSGGDVVNSMVPLRDALSNMSAMKLEDDVARRARHGVTVPVSGDLKNGELVQMCDLAGELIAIGKYERELKSIHPHVVFVTGDL